MNDKKKIIKNAMIKALEDGYNQIIIKDLTDNTYSFDRKHSNNIIFDFEKVIGNVITYYEDEILYVEYIEMEEFKNENQ